MTSSQLTYNMTSSTTPPQQYDVTLNDVVINGVITNNETMTSFKQLSQIYHNLTNYNIFRNDLDNVTSTPPLHYDVTISDVNPIDASQIDVNSQQHHWWLYLRGCIVTLITLGIIGSNVVNLKIWSRNTRMPWATRRFLVNLSSCDLLVGLVATSSAIYPAFTGEWPYGSVWCQITGITHGMSVTLSIWSIAMVGIDRFIAAVKPFAYSHLMSRPCSCRIIIGMWLASAITYIAPLFTKSNFQYYQYSPSEAICGLYWEYPAYCVITALYVPCLSAAVLVYTSYKIQKTLQVHDSKPLNYTNQSHYSKQRTKMNQRALKIVMTTSICYFISWGPYVILAVARAIQPSIQPSAWISFIAMWTANANSMLNVFIYSFTNTYFQAEAKTLFRFNQLFFNKEQHIQDLISKEQHSSENRYQLCVFRREDTALSSAQTPIYQPASNGSIMYGQSTSTLTTMHCGNGDVTPRSPSRYSPLNFGDPEVVFNERQQVKRSVSMPAAVYTFLADQESRL